jgi:hypothetical protein
LEPEKRGRLTAKKLRSVKKKEAVLLGKAATGKSIRNGMWMEV